MPTYEYACALGHTYLEVRLMSEEQRCTQCPTCGAELKRRFYAPPITFKGQGFYSGSG